MIAGMLSGCSSDSPELIIVEIGERFFVAQVDDIYINPDNYKDKMIVIEGMYSTINDVDEIYNIVYRLTPGCCPGDDDLPRGFMFRYDGVLPQENDWIKATGTPEIEIHESGETGVFLNLTDLEIMSTRGAELVTN